MDGYVPVHSFITNEVLHLSLETDLQGRDWDGREAYKAHNHLASLFDDSGVALFDTIGVMAGMCPHDNNQK